MAVFPKRITLKNSPDTEAAIKTAISSGGADEILPGEVVIGTETGNVLFYTRDDVGNIVTLGGVSDAAGCIVSETEPTTMPSGNALIEGTLWYNPTTDALHAYSSGAWVVINTGGESLIEVNGWSIDSDATTATSKTIDAPSHFEGDLLIACVMSRTSGLGLTPPSGWSLYGTYLGSMQYSGDTQTISVFTKTAGVSEPASYTWTMAAGARICGFIVSVPGEFSIRSVAENYGNGQDATISTMEGVLNITAATWIYSDTGSGEAYSQTHTAAGFTEITDSPNTAARISGGYTIRAGTVTSYHDATNTSNDPNHGMIRILVSTFSSINDNDDVDTATTPPTDGQVLTWNDANSQWEPEDPSGGVASVDGVGANGISVTGGPITSSGSLTVTLDDTTVTPGTYTSANLTVDAQGRITAAANGSGGGGGGSAARSSLSAVTTAIAANASENVTVALVGKAGQLLAVETDQAAWVAIYTSQAARTADASRFEDVSPDPGSGVIAEVITTGAERILVTPCINYFNDEATPLGELYLKVVNKSGSTVAITTTLTVLPTEA